MKYTDEQIKKALKCCGEEGCEKCPMNFIMDDIGCKLYIGLYILALDLINRQEAEIERLKQDLKITMKNYVEGGKIIKSEAIKEFAERLKEKIHDSVYQYWNFGEGGYYLAEDVDDDIGNLVKEMVGESNVD